LALQHVITASRTQHTETRSKYAIDAFPLRKPSNSSTHR
jgi:hypothetical protein